MARFDAVWRREPGIRDEVSDGLLPLPSPSSMLHDLVVARNDCAISECLLCEYFLFSEI